MQINLLLAWLEREDILNEIQNRFSEVAPLILDYNYTVSEKQKLAVAQNIHQFYLQGKTISTDTTCNFIQVRWNQSKIRGIEILFEVYTVQIMVPCGLIRGCRCFGQMCILDQPSIWWQVCPNCCYTPTTETASDNLAHVATLWLEFRKCHASCQSLTNLTGIIVVSLSFQGNFSIVLANKPWLCPPKLLNFTEHHEAPTPLNTCTKQPKWKHGILE